MKKVLLFFIIILFTSVAAFSQQKILVSQYMLNHFLVNPAVAGTSDYFEANAGYRHQWAGLEGAPRTFYLTAHGPLGKAPDHYNWKGKKRYHHGIGVYAGVDNTHLLSRTMIYGAYSFNLPLSKNLRWSNGIFLGIQQHKIDGSEVRMDGFDASLPPTDINKIVPDVSIGSWLYSKDFYVGLSANQIMRNRLDYSVNDVEEVGRLKYHYFLTGGYKYPFYHGEMEWVPSLMLRYVHPSPVSVDFNNKVIYKKKYWAGLSYRHNDAVAILAGITLLNSLHIGYSYDFSISDLSGYHTNSHEFVVGYSFKENFDVWSPQMFW